MDTFVLRTDGGTQPRESLDEATVERYREDMALGLWDFARASDPAVAFYDGSTYWLADGYHRLEAASRAGMLDEFSAALEIRQGTVRDAILYSCGANAYHGLPRSNDDKRRSVSRLLDDPEWSKWSDREIARRCHVDHRFVSRLRQKLTGDIPSERTYATKHGTVATMDTSRIGRSPQRAAEPADEPAGDLVPEVEVAQGSRATGGMHSDPTVAPAQDRRREAAPADPVGNLRTEPVGDLDVDPSLPGKRAAGKAVTEGPSDVWCDDQLHRKALVEQGRAVVVHTCNDYALIAWARSDGRLVAIDRMSIWGNPFCSMRTVRANR